MSAATLIDPLEKAACTPEPVDPAGFNSAAVIPYGLTIAHIERAMNDFIEFLGFVNEQLHTKGIPRLESFMMQANFSSMVGEFMNSTLPKYCFNLVKNERHNGHPDLVPKGVYPMNATLHGKEGIEVKGSRKTSGWQGHNAEECWLMVFIFDSNTPRDAGKGKPPRPFRFRMVLGAKLELTDWRFSGRKGASRRTITATVLPPGRVKMLDNWIYKEPTKPKTKKPRKTRAVALAVSPHPETPSLILIPEGVEPPTSE